jgi:hypothetical protein
MSDLQPILQAGELGPVFDVPADVLAAAGKPEPGQSPLAPNVDARLSAVESTSADTMRRVTDLEVAP